MLETLRQFGSKLTAFLDTLDPLAHFLLVIGVMVIQFLVFVYVTVPCAKFVGRETWRGARGISKVFGSLFNFRSKPGSPLYQIVGHLIMASKLDGDEGLSHGETHFPFDEKYYKKHTISVGGFGISIDNSGQWLNYVLTEAELKRLHQLVLEQREFLIRDDQIKAAEIKLFELADKDPQSPPPTPSTHSKAAPPTHTKDGVRIQHQIHQVGVLTHELKEASETIEAYRRQIETLRQEKQSLEGGNRQLLKRLDDLKEERKKRREAEGILRNAIDVYCDVANVGTSNPANPDAFEAIKQALTDMAATLADAGVPLAPFIPKHREHYIHLLSDYALDEYFQTKRQQRV